MKEKKLTILIISLIFASLVWLSVNMGNTFQTTIELPIRIEHLSADKAIATPLPKTIGLKIQSDGWHLLNVILSPNLRYTIDFSQLSRKDTVFTYNDLNKHINLPKDIHIFETSPETVYVQIDDKITKRIPVEPDVTTLYKEGFGIVGSILANPESISVTGARNLLNKIHSWKTEHIIIRDINAPVSTTASLLDSLNLEIERSHSTALLSFDVQPIAEKTIDNIAIKINQVPEQRSVVLIPPTLSVIVRSGVNAIAPLTEKDFDAFVDYKSILLDTSGYIQPTIIGPANIRIVRQIPEKIQYVIRK
jgi:hypothetical protein